VASTREEGLEKDGIKRDIQTGHKKEEGSKRRLLSQRSRDDRIALNREPGKRNCERLRISRVQKGEKAISEGGRGLLSKESGTKILTPQFSLGRRKGNLVGGKAFLRVKRGGVKHLHRQGNVEAKKEKKKECQISEKKAEKSYSTSSIKESFRRNTQPKGREGRFSCGQGGRGRERLLGGEKRG